MPPEKRPGKEAKSPPKAAAPAPVVEVPDGITDDGVKFKVPDTLHTMGMIINPANWNAASLLTLLFTVAHSLLALFGGLPRWVHLCIFLFWRCSYNIGLGFLLHKQSREKLITKLYERWTKPSNSLRARIVRYLASYGASPRTNPDEYPAAFNSWLAFRHLVDLILWSDVCNYICLVYKSVELPDSFTLLVVLQYLLGFFLGVFNYWAKIDAHRCIGDYCWYWGDFFFLKDQELTFDGIFELFPHPMYTVGYSHYYGASLICRSYPLLFVSLAAHLMQLSFLMFVEEPHIERTYGKSKPQLDAEQVRALYDRSNLFPDKHRSFFSAQWHAFIRTDFSLLMFAGYALVVFLFLDPVFSLVQVVVWRCVHWIGLGYTLWCQSKRKAWTKYYEDRHRNLYEAFDEWKRVYNISLQMNILVFVLFAIKYAPSLAFYTVALDSKTVGLTALGLVLIGLGVWTAKSMYDVIGDYGWYYGDFFIRVRQNIPSLAYTGIYRFLNNPDCFVGYAGLYGMSLITQSWTVFALAFLSQCMNILFLYIVEIPHMNTLYANKRKAAPLRRVLSQRLVTMLPMLSEETKLERQLKLRARKIRLDAIKEVYDIYKKMDKLRSEFTNKIRDGVSSLEDKKPGSGKAGKPSEVLQWAELEASEQVLVGEPLQVKFRTVEDRADTDWIGLYDIHVPSAPGHSDGRWRYVTSSGVVTFDGELLPKYPGVFELRYHRKDTYQVLCRRPVRIMPRDAEGDEVKSPLSPPSRERTPGPSPPKSRKQQDDEGLALLDAPSRGVDVDDLLEDVLDD